MKKNIYAFLKRHVDLYNCGQHDWDNSFLNPTSTRSREEIKNMTHTSGGLVEEFAAWQASHEGCEPIGICKENVHHVPGMQYFAMVFEDERGGRYFTHVPGYWLAEYEVFDQGEEVMEKARREYHDECHKRDFGRKSGLSEEELDEASEQLKEVENNEEDEDDTQRPNPCIRTDYDPDDRPIESREQDQEDEKPKLKNFTPDPNAKTEHVYFTCDALHTLEIAFNYMNEAGEIGTALGIKYVYDTLTRIAKRAAELDDPELHIPMLLLHLYDVDDVYGAINEMKEKLREKEPA